LIAKRLFSPHCDPRPVGVGIDLLVLHAISLPDGMFSSAYITALFMGELTGDEHPSFVHLKGVRVSAHYLVDRQGHIVQFVADQDRAWHAGVSLWQGRTRCNDYSIGIEIIGDEYSPFTAGQYQATTDLCHHLIGLHPSITMARIVGHADIAPYRKWDPGKQWHWRRFRHYLNRKQ